ncbi:unnamed protein product [Mucor circinelloides]
MASLNESLKLYAKNAKNPRLADFLEDPRCKRSFLDFICQYTRPRDARVASKRKCRNFANKKFVEGVNWKLLLMQAKARQKALERSTAVLTAATDEAANTLENLFNTGIDRASNDQADEQDNAEYRH